MVHFAFLKTVMTPAGGLIMLFGVARAGTLHVPSIEHTSISHAMIDARGGDTVLVQPGKYHDHVMVKPGVVLLARDPEKTVVTGGGRGIVVTLSRNSAVIGLTIRNGAIGVSSRGTSNAIMRCRIRTNSLYGIVCALHLPAIEDNLVAFNGEGGVVCRNVQSLSVMVEHNTIAYNEGAGIALQGNTYIQVRNNIVAFNRLYGIALSGKSSKSIVGCNNLFGNLRDFRQLPGTNFAFDPRFVSPRLKGDFRLKSGSPLRGKACGGGDIGMRFASRQHRHGRENKP